MDALVMPLQGSSTRKGLTDKLEKLHGLHSPGSTPVRQCLFWSLTGC